MQRYYNIHDMVRIRSEADTAVGRAVHMHLSHFECAPERAENPNLTFSDQVPKPGPGHILTAEGLVLDGDCVYMDDGFTAVRMPEPGRMEVFTRRGISDRFFVQLLLVTKGMTLVHCAGIDRAGEGILFPAWGGVGKTSLVAGLLKDPDTRLLGDDFVILAKDARIYSYPLPFSLYDYHAELFPGLVGGRGGRRSFVPRFVRRFLEALRPAAIPILARYPRLEEFGRRIGRGYCVTPVAEVVPAEQIGVSAPVRKVVLLARWDGTEFKMQTASVDKAIRQLLGVVHYEFESAPFMRYLLTLASFSLMDLADYFGTMKGVLQRAVADVPILEMLIPQRAAVQEIGEFFKDHVG